MTSVASRPHVRLSKLRCVDKIAPRSGYRRWREMQLRMNRAMQRVLQGRAEMSLLLPGRIPGKEEGKRKKKKKKTGRMSVHDLANSDECPDADVKFYAVPPSHRVSEHSRILRDQRGRQGRQSRSLFAAASTLLPQVILVGTEDHITVVLAWPRIREIEYFDTCPRNRQLEQIEEFFEERAPGATFRRVNSDLDVQGLEEDIMCHTYIHWYAHARLVLGLASEDVLEGLRAMSARERLDAVREFQDWLLGKFEHGTLNS